MSRTYNQRHKLNSVRPKYEFPQGYDTLCWGEIKPGETTTHDYSGTTDDKPCDNGEVTRMACRHPNKKRNRKLLKEFKMTGVDYLGTSIIGFDHRLGDINDRRRRKSAMRLENKKRRFKLKMQTQRIIDNET